MNRLHLPLVLAILAGCSAPDAGFMGGPDPMAVRGVHDAIDGIDIWTDSVPPRDFEVVQDNVALTSPDPSAPMLFPAQRIRAAADVAREANADAAIISSEYTDDATSATGYNYEVDIVRYTE